MNQSPKKILFILLLFTSRWYRSPELLLGAPAYGYGVDIWAVGCIFAELMLRTPYLAGESDMAQLQIIFKALGTPTEEEWPVRKSRERNWGVREANDPFLSSFPSHIFCTSSHFIFPRE